MLCSMESELDMPDDLFAEAPALVAPMAVNLAPSWESVTTFNRQYPSANPSLRGSDPPIRTPFARSIAIA